MAVLPPVAIDGARSSRVPHPPPWRAPAPAPRPRSTPARAPLPHPPRRGRRGAPTPRRSVAVPSSSSSGWRHRPPIVRIDRSTPVPVHSSSVISLTFTVTIRRIASLDGDGQEGAVELASVHVGDRLLSIRGGEVDDRSESSMGVDLACVSECQLRGPLLYPEGCKYHSLRRLNGISTVLTSP